MLSADLKRWNQKRKSCIKHLVTVNKLLRLWYFVRVLNLKFLDQLERRHCKDTPFFRPFYIGAPKGPFLWGLRSSWTEYYTSHFLVLGSDIFHSNKTYSFILPTPDCSSCLCRSLIEPFLSFFSRMFCLRLASCRSYARGILLLTL